MLTKKLTIAEQKDILSTLFGFNYLDVDENGDDQDWVLYDDEGNEFYGSDENCKFDLSTLSGIFTYASHRAKKEGYADAQYNIRKALGLD